MIQRHVFVTGRVQGVGFRAFILRKAKKYPTLRGFVRNLQDGRVEAVFSGKDEEVLALSAACKTGPSLAQVTHLEVIEESVDLKLELFSLGESV